MNTSIIVLKIQNIFSIVFKYVSIFACNVIAKILYGLFFSKDKKNFQSIGNTLKKIKYDDILKIILDKIKYILNSLKSFFIAMGQRNIHSWAVLSSMVIKKVVTKLILKCVLNDSDKSVKINVIFSKFCSSLSTESSGLIIRYNSSYEYS